MADPEGRLPFDIDSIARPDGADSVGTDPFAALFEDSAIDDAGMASFERAFHEADDDARSPFGTLEGLDDSD